MNPMELFNQVKEMIEKKDFEAAKKFVDENKDDLGEYFDQAKSLVSGNEMVSGALDKMLSLFLSIHSVEVLNRFRAFTITHLFEFFIKFYNRFFLCDSLC